MPINAADNLLTKYWNGSLPVDPLAIASKLGAVVIPRDDLNGVSGMIELMPNNIPVISCNSLEPNVRQRFTLAHEVGHLALKHLTPERPFFRDTRNEMGSSQWSPLERDANTFAANLLMPARIVNKAVLESGITSIARLAQLFDVSEIAMTYRLQDLGLIKR